MGNKKSAVQGDEFFLTKSHIATMANSCNRRDIFPISSSEDKNK